jgi:hypothetical protein
VLAHRERPDSAHQQPVLLERRLVLGLDEPVGRLEHDRPGRVQRVVLAQRATERAQRLDLRDDVEGPARAQLEVDVHERFEPRAEA